MVALRFLAGYDVTETAYVLAVSRTTVERDSRVARSRLKALMRASCPEA